MTTAPTLETSCATAPLPTRLGRALRRIAFSIPLDEATAAKRGFQVDRPAMRAHIETIGTHFVESFNRAIVVPSIAGLASELDRIEVTYRGFGYEGAAMGLAVRDSLWRGPSLWQAFVRGPAARQEYIAVVGRGWALARLPGPTALHMRDMRGPLRWLAFDGYGFHEGFFDWRRSVDRRQTARHIKGYAARAFDQGLGRSLWFVRGACAPAIIDTIARFEQRRQADLWAGVGLAATYAAGADEVHLDMLLAAAGANRGALCQGAVFAAEARSRGAVVTEQTAAVLQRLCGIDVARASQLATSTRPLDDMEDPDGIAYEGWRSAIRRHFD